MLVHNCEQNSPEWYQARLGVITASQFSKLITPKTMKLSAQADGLENRIVAEIITGKKEDEFCGNGWTEQGQEREPEAVEFYEMQSGNETIKVGFVTNDEKTFGCSPDRLIGEDGLLEIKCPAAHTHIASLLSGSIGDEHKPQVQGQLFVTERKWADVFSYHPELPPSIIRVERDEEYIGKLRDALNQFLLNVQTKIKKVTGE